jgi:aspartyl-tRNA(Asn)/glutamyl-tRNA(Gln) amidotransferase subunit C
LPAAVIGSPAILGRAIARARPAFSAKFGPQNLGLESSGMALDKSTVRNIASLARIRVPEDALDGLAEELSNILGWIEQLNEVDTDGVEPMASVTDMTFPARSDDITDGGIPDDVLANAPERENSYFTVPKVIE